MTSQITVSGKHKRETSVCNIENKKDDSPLKSRFITVRARRESEVIEIDTDITSPGANKQTKWTVTDKLIKKSSHENFVTTWTDTVDKGLTFDFFSDPLVRKDILVTVQCVDSIITFSSTKDKYTTSPRRTVWTAKILSETDDRLNRRTSGS